MENFGLRLAAAILDLLAMELPVECVQSFPRNGAERLTRVRLGPSFPLPRLASLLALLLRDRFRRLERHAEAAEQLAPLVIAAGRHDERDVILEID